MLRRALAAQAAVVCGGAAAIYAYRAKGEGGSRRSLPHGKEGMNVTPQQCLDATASVIAAARYGFCCIASKDGSPPTCRVMDLNVSKDGSLRCWLITRDWTRKATALRETKQCSLAFHDPRAAGENGYAVLYGGVRELTSATERERHWKPSWSYFHAGGPYGPSVVWEFAPERVEVISHAHAIAPAWQPATLLKSPADGSWALKPLVGRNGERDSG